jgi:hypothetical protein
MIAVKKGTNSWRAATSLYPDEVEYKGIPGRDMVWDAALGNMRPKGEPKAKPKAKVEVKATPRKKLTVAPTLKTRRVK